MSDGVNTHPAGLRGLQALAWSIGNDDAMVHGRPLHRGRYDRRFRASYRRGYLAGKAGWKAFSKALGHEVRLRPISLSR